MLDLFCSQQAIFYTHRLVAESGLSLFCFFNLPIRGKRGERLDDNNKTIWRCASRSGGEGVNSHILNKCQQNIEEMERKYACFCLFDAVWISYGIISYRTKVPSKVYDIIPT